MVRLGLWLLGKTVEVRAQLITFCWGREEAMSTLLIETLFVCGHLVKTTLASFLLPPGISLLVKKLTQRPPTLVYSHPCLYQVLTRALASVIHTLGFG